MKKFKITAAYKKGYDIRWDDGKHQMVSDKELEKLKKLFAWTTDF